MLGTVLSILASGHEIGWLARWGVPGPDPMPRWLTFLFGLGGSLVGGGLAYGLLGGGKNISSADYFTIVLAEILAAMLLIILYRRLVQGRPITGPDAKKLPTRGIGIARFRERLRRMGIDPDTAGATTPQGTKGELLQRLDELHDQGVLTDEEYVEKRREILRRDA